MRKIFLAVAIATLVTGVLALKRSQRAHARPIASGFSVFLTLVSDGKLIAHELRLVKGNGEFLSVMDYVNADGSVSKRTQFAGSLTRGAVSIDETNKRLVYQGRPALVQDVSVDELKKAGGYVREDSLLGYRVVVQRNCDAIERCTEYWIAPELGSDVLKFDMVHEGHRLTKEAVSISIGEPTFEIPDYPIRQSSRLANQAKP